MIAEDVAGRVEALERRPGGEIQPVRDQRLGERAAAESSGGTGRRSTRVVLGCGRRLFVDGAVPTALRLVESSTTPSGTTFQTYRQAGAVEHGSFAL